MLQNYFKIAWRNLSKRKFYTLITVVGLAVGMTFSFLMLGYVWGEINVNKDLRNSDRQYLLRSKWKQPEMGLDITTLAPLAKTLKEEYPALVENYYRYDGITVAISQGDRHFREDVQTGDSTLLLMYGLPLLQGDARSALNQPNSVAITENKAIKYFGRTNVLGEMLTFHNFLGGKQRFQVTAVIRDLSNNSVTHLLPNQAEIFIPFGSLEGRKGSEDNWGFPYIVNYIELKNGVSRQDLDIPLKQIINTHAPENFRSNLQVYLTPLTDYYLEANNGLVKKMILTLTAITAFILLMAIVNFVNISIGRSSSRVKEIGVRKVLGSLKRQLITQFLAESMMLSLISMVLSIGLYEVFRPLFEDILNQPLRSVISLFPYSLILPVLFALMIGLIGGAYPALVLSSLPSVDSMKGKLKSINENVLLRRLLVGSQFAVAVFVFAGALIISKQVHYFFNKNLGYQKESVMTVGVPRDWTAEGLAKMESLRDQFSHLREVSKVSLSYEIPNGNNGVFFGVYRMGQDSAQAIHTQFLGTDENYADAYRIKMLAGKFFHGTQETFQPGKIVLNLASVKALGFKSADEAVGQQVRVHNFKDPVTIAGITEDFHFESMHKAITPLAFVHINGGVSYRYLTFRLPPGDMAKSIASIGEKWRELMPGAPFEYKFLDETLQILYRSEIQLRSASQVATVLAIIIVLLGILGMVSLNVAKRTKELGIRKVLGASSSSLILIFLYEFLFVLMLAIIVSFPLVYVLMGKWLDTFAYHVPVAWEDFVWTGVAFATIIALLVWLQTYKAASMNPVKAIKME